MTSLINLNFNEAVEDAVDDLEFWTMKAKYNTVCKSCLSDIKSGDQIIKSPLSDPAIWIHEKCMTSEIEKYWKENINMDDSQRQAILDTIPWEDGWDKWFPEYGEGTHGFDASDDLLETFKGFMRYGQLSDSGCRFIKLILNHALGKDQDLAIGVNEKYSKAYGFDWMCDGKDPQQVLDEAVADASKEAYHEGYTDGYNACREESILRERERVEKYLLDKDDDE